jgi:plasmid stability protein
MLVCMRTTIKLADDVFKAYKQRAAERGTTFAQEVEEALRADLHARRQPVDEEPYVVPVFDGGGTGALIDINSNQALQNLMDEEDRAGGAW